MYGVDITTPITQLGMWVERGKEAEAAAAKAGPPPPPSSSSSRLNTPAGSSIDLQGAAANGRCVWR